MTVRDISEAVGISNEQVILYRKLKINFLKTVFAKSVAIVSNG